MAKNWLKLVAENFKVNKKDIITAPTDHRV